MSVLFVTGTDTGVGKTLATGLLARFLLSRGERVLTMKLVQTGCDGVPEDLELHRRLMGTGPAPEDASGLACPYVLKFPASPHLAARLEGIEIAPARLAAAARRLEARCDRLLVEGAGGLCVPLADEVTTLDFVAGQGWPVAVVAPARLGSLNHILLTLARLAERAVAVRGLVYNLHPAERPEIAGETRRYLRAHFPAVPLVDLPAFSVESPPAVDFGAFFE